MNVRELIMGLRGEPAPKCDACNAATPVDDLIPVSGGEWMCAKCCGYLMDPKR